MASTWARTGRVFTNDTALVVRFTGVPTGNKEKTRVDVEVGVDNLRRTAIYGIRLDRPITARRLKALPLEALRTSAGKIIDREVQTQMGETSDALNYETGESYTFSYPEAPSLTSIDISGTPASQRRSDEFLIAVAEVCRDARRQGVAAWRAVSDAAGVKQAQAQRYIAEADRRAKSSKTKREAKQFDTGRLQRMSDKVED